MHNSVQYMSRSSSQEGFFALRTSLLPFFHSQNKKEQSGTDVPPPIWVHPDYIFNADAMITQMKQIRDISEAGMHSRLHDASPVCSNKQIAQQTTPSFFLSFFLLILCVSFLSFFLSFFSPPSTLPTPTSIAIATVRPPPRLPALLSALLSASPALCAACK